MSEDDSYQSDYKLLLEEQVLRLQGLVVYLLEKNEQLRQTIAPQSKKGYVAHTNDLED